MNLDSLKNISKNIKVLVFLIFSMVLLFSFLLFAILPTQDETTLKENKIKMESLRLSKIQTFYQKNSDYDKFLKVQNLKKKAVYEKIPNRINVMRIMAKYSNLAEKYDLELVSIKPQKIKKINKKYYGLPVNINLTGNYYDLLLFLQDIENKGQLVSLTSPRFKGERGDNINMTAELMVFSLQGETYD